MTELRVFPRRFPYPYRAMLAICSDLDETPDLETYLAISRYLNTCVETPMGTGVGLEVGNTIYFDMPTGQFSYWNTDDRGREWIHALVRSGHIDCLHSYGDLAVRRDHAARALAALIHGGGVPPVWVDHAVSPSNFGGDIMCGTGDVIGAPAYHADLTCGAGVKYVWRGRVTSTWGQDVRRSWAGIWSHRKPLTSSRTLFKEGLKALLARAGLAKYRMHAGNALTRKVRLRDGREVVEFIRSNPNQGGVSAGDTGRALHQALHGHSLTRLTDRGGTAVLYTHLGKRITAPSVPLTREARGALKLLAEFSRDQRILVTTTFRLLEYREMLNRLTFSISGDSRGFTSIRIESHHTPDELQGLTFYVPEPELVEVLIGKAPLKGLQANRADHTGIGSVTIPWKPLRYPEP